MQCNIYRIMLEPEAFLQSSGKRLKSEVIIRLKAPFNCFRTSRSLLWLLKWNSRLLFVIMTPVLSQWPALSFIKNNNLFKRWKDALIRYMCSVIRREISHTDCGSGWSTSYKKISRHGVMFLWIIYNNNFSICIALERFKLTSTFCLSTKN